MKSVGVLTFHDVPNFGAVLQAWAMVMLLRDLDCKVEIINYTPEGQALKFKRTGLKAIIPSLGGILRKRFTAKNLPVSPRMTTNLEVTNYVDKRQLDCVVCGSDQIWMKDKFIGFDSTYFLDIGKNWNGRKISFAPSCGDMMDYGSDAENVVRCLKTFHALSVRDRNAKQIVNNLGLNNVSLVVDPTLIVDFEPIIRNSPPLKDDYLAVTGAMNAASNELVRKIAAKLNLKVVALGTKCSVADIDKRFVDPAQWATYIAHAKFVITSLFHGTMLSLRFCKPFLSIGVAGRTLKISDALERFGLSHRFLTPNEDGRFQMKVEYLDMDYSNCREMMQKEVADSKDFIKKAIFE